jgi:hypothetical protein
MSDAVFFIEAVRGAYGMNSWSNGVSRNEGILNAFLRYAHKQGYTSGRLQLRDLFPPSMMDT